MKRPALISSSPREALPCSGLFLGRPVGVLSEGSACRACCPGDRPQGAARPGPSSCESVELLSVPARGPQGPPVAPGLKDAKLNHSQIFTGAASDLVAVRGGSEQVEKSSLAGGIVWELLDSVSDGRALEPVQIFDRMELHRIPGF